MSRRKGILGSFVGLLAVVLACSASLCAQTGALQRPLITQSIDEDNLVKLVGNTRPEMTPANDRGAVSDDLQLENMYLLLNRSPEQERLPRNW